MVFELFSEGTFLLWIQEHLRCGFLNTLLVPFTHTGDIGLIWIGFGLIFLIFKSTRKGAVLALISFVLSFMLCDLFLKLIVNRQRPFDVIPGLAAIIDRPRGTSFPSGHTTTAFGFALCYFLNTNKKWTGWLILALAVVMGFSRLYAGVHYPSDVITGVIVGSVASLLTTFVVEKIIKKKQEKKSETETEQKA